MILPDSSRPLYEQLKNMLIKDIVSGKYKYGARLPSEMGLAQSYGLSRITVRRALAELVAEGYLSSQPGKGTFVSFMRSEHRLLSFAGYSEKSTNDTAPINPSTHILAKEEIGVEGEIAKNLRVPEGTKVIRLKRVMSESDKPYMIDTAYFVVAQYPGLFDLLVDDVSTFALMKEHYKVDFAKAVKVLGVIRAGLEESRLLHCIPGDPLFSISKVIFDRHEVPIHYSRYFVQGDRCVYTLTVTGDMKDMQVHYRDEEESSP